MYCQINLLPPNKRKVIFNVYLLYYLRFFTEILLGYSAIIATVFILSYYFLNISLKDFQGKTLSMDKEYTQINQEIAQINKNLKKIDTAQTDIVDWPSYLYQIFSIKSEGVVLSGLDIQKNSRTLLLQGRASTREALLALLKNLETLAFLKKIDLPPSALTAKQNIDFNIRAELSLN